MKTKNFLMIFAVVAWVLSACQPAATELPPATSVPPTNTPLSANTSLPTNTTMPTLTPAPTNTRTPLPEGVLFRDEFAGELAPGWIWENEVKDRWTITEDGWLQILGENDLLLGAGRQSNLLCRDVPDGDFAISTHIITNPNANFQQVTLFLLEDADNYVAINRGYCDLGPCLTGGDGFYMDYKVNGSVGSYKIATKETDVYLKIQKEGEVISGFYSTTPDDWQREGRFGNMFNFNRVCMGAANGADVNSDIVGLFDYFEISLPK